MSAARTMMTMAFWPSAGGGLLAIATIPALAPYQQRKPERVPAPVFAPESGASRLTAMARRRRSRRPAMTTRGSASRASLSRTAILAKR